MHFIYSIISLLTKLGKTFPKRIDSFWYQFKHVSFLFIHSFGRSVQATSGGRWGRRIVAIFAITDFVSEMPDDLVLRCPRPKSVSAPPTHTPVSPVQRRYGLRGLSLKHLGSFQLLNHHDRSRNLVKSSLLHIGLENAESCLPQRQRSDRFRDDLLGGHRVPRADHRGGGTAEVQLQEGRVSMWRPGLWILKWNDKMKLGS